MHVSKKIFVCLEKEQKKTYTGKKNPPSPQTKFNKRKMYEGDSSDFGFAYYFGQGAPGFGIGGPLKRLEQRPKTNSNRKRLGVVRVGIQKSAPKKKTASAPKAPKKKAASAKKKVASASASKKKTASAPKAPKKKTASASASKKNTASAPKKNTASKKKAASATKAHKKAAASKKKKAASKK